MVLLDVREPYELEQAALGGYPQVVVGAAEPAGCLWNMDGLPPCAAQESKAAKIVVFCHHGWRSAQVTLWLRQQGWTDVTSMAGGIDAWAQEIDSSVGCLLDTPKLIFIKSFILICPNLPTSRIRLLFRHFFIAALVIAGF